MPYRYIINFYCKLRLRLSTHSVASAINKSNQKHSNKQIKKWYPYLRYCPIALGKSFHCFLKMLTIFRTTTFIIYNSQFIITFRHPQKSKGERKSVKFQCRMKSILIICFGFFIRPSKFYTLSKDDYLPNQLPFLQISSDYKTTFDLVIQNKK